MLPQNFARIWAVQGGPLMSSGKLLGPGVWTHPGTLNTCTPGTKSVRGGRENVSLLCLLKVLFIIPSCFFKGTPVAEYYLEHFVSSRWLDRKRTECEFTFYPQEDCLGEALQCSGQKQDPVQNAWCLNSGFVTSSLCDVTRLHLFPHL